MYYRLLFGMIFPLLFVSGCGMSASEPQFRVIYTDQSKKTVREEVPKKEYRIAVVPKLVNIPYFNAVEDGAREAGKDLGIDVMFTGPLLADPEQQIKVIQDLITKKVDAIAVSADDLKQLDPILVLARKSNIKVITWDSDTLPEAREFFVSPAQSDTLGRHLMDTLAQRLNEQGEYAIMTASFSAPNQDEWMNSLWNQQQEYYPHMRLVDVVATDDDPHKAYSLAQKLLRDHPNLKGIIGISSVAPPAAAQVVEESGKMGKVEVVGLSTPNVMRSYIKAGVSPIVTLWSPKKLGYLTVALCKGLLDGQMPYDGEEINGVGNIRVVGDEVFMGETLDFTAKNVDQYDF